MGDAARPACNITLDTSLLSRLAARVGAPRVLSVHHLVDLSHARLTARELETRLSSELADAQANAAAEIQACR